MLIVKGIKIKDENGDVALEAGNLTVGFKLWPMLKNKLVITTVRLFGVKCDVKKETEKSDTNIQFLIDALSGDSQIENDIELQVKSILIRRGNIKYNVLDKAKINRFDPNHIDINNINGKVSIRFFNKDSLHAQINKLSFNEASGFNVKKIALSVIRNRDSTSIKNIALSLPRSSIYIPSAVIKTADGDSVSIPFREAPVFVSIGASKIIPSDFTAFVPSLKKISDAIELSADISGLINSISLNRLTVKYGKDLYFRGNMNLKRIANNKDLYLLGRAEKLEVTPHGLNKVINNFREEELLFSEQIMNLEQLNFTGEISGFTNHLVAFGQLSSSIGSVQMDMLIGRNEKSNADTLYFKGNLASSELRINELFEEGNPYGAVSFSAEVDFTSHSKQKMNGNVKAQIKEFEYNGYNYEKILLSGNFKEDEYKGLVHIDDPNGRLEVQGLFSRKEENPIFDFTATLQNFRPDKLHVTDKYINPDISFSVNANFTGNNPDDFEGHIKLSDLAFYTKTDSFEIKNMLIETFAHELPQKSVKISSDILNGEINGRYSFLSLPFAFHETIENYLPSLSAISEEEKVVENNQFKFQLSIANTEKISRTLKLPIAIREKSVINGYYDNVGNTFGADISIPAFNIGAIALEHTHLKINNEDDAINIDLGMSQYSKNKVHNRINLASEAKNDSIKTTLHWENDKEEKFVANVNTSTLFIKETNKKLRTEIMIHPTQVTLQDSLWNIYPASVTMSNGNIHIDNISITKGNQYVHIDGLISDHPKESLLVDLKDIETDFIFDMLNIPALQFGGKATGKIVSRDLKNSMMINGNLEVLDFSFNKAVQGKLNISSEWDNDRKGILLLGTIYKNDSTWTDINGYIYPMGKNQGLSLYFDANEINLGFLQKYMKAFASDISGLGYGNIHLYGTFSDVVLKGTPYIKDGNMKINLLGTAYKFSDSVFMDKGSIIVKNIALSDKDENTGILNIEVAHKSFKDINYKIGMRTDKLLIYDISKNINPRIYGQVYANGTAQINGTEKQISVEGSVRSEAGTSIGFNFMQNPTAENYDFISFINSNTEDLNAPKEDTHEKSKPGIAYTIKASANVTPDAQIELVMDPASGDRIKGNGSGNIEILYGSRDDIQMFGNYLISNGTYNFSLQQVIRKRFNIRDGSSVSFHGDPLTANLNINTTYNLTANIQDLDESLIMETANTSIPVNCILNLEGRLQNPTISFDLELPNSNSELERQVKSFIDTEDMMTRQIIYLLVLNKFYTPDYSRNDYRSNEFSAVASSAISAQLSNILSSLTDKVQIGTNIRSRQDGVDDTEVAMLLSSQLLDNRLIFNGNFGYKDNYIQSNAFVGEFDLEYKLTRSGEISLKAYNHANDLYRYNTKSLTRQGVGIMFRKDFSSLSDIFKRKR